MKLSRTSTALLAIASLTFAAGCSENAATPRLAPTAALQSRQAGFTIVHEFQGAPRDGYVGEGLIEGPGGAAYGTTVYGGSIHPRGCTIGCGTVYEFDGSTEQLIYSFGPQPDGALPIGSLRLRDGVFYGATQSGGSTGDGTVYALSKTSGGKWTETKLYDFKGPPDGSDPDGIEAIDARGRLYGTTFMGGAGTTCLFGTSGCGTVFMLTPPTSKNAGWQETILHSFTGIPDGAAPGESLVRMSDGTLFGITQYGGTSDQCPGLQGCGTLYRLHPGANGKWSARVVHSFNVEAKLKDGSLPSDLIDGGDGNLYGTTEFGGGTSGCATEKGVVGCGTFYSFTPGHREPVRITVLHAFAGGSDGGEPDHLNGAAATGFYGSTEIGGGGICQAYEGCGTVFGVSRHESRWTEKVLHGFVYGEGEIPAGPLVVRGTKIFGTASYGGTGPCPLGCGTLYELDVKTP